MKKVFLLMMLFIWTGSSAQITVDFQKFFAINYFRLNNTATKYTNADFYFQSPEQFSLYNLDGSLYKNIQLPPKPKPSAFIEGIFLISTTLFDNDSSNIEYLISYRWDSLSVGLNCESKIVREDGTILLDEMSATPYYWPPKVFSTEQGTKLILFYQFANQTVYQSKVFSLPGKLDYGIEEGMDIPKGNPILYPNPNDGSFYINFSSKEGNVKKIDLYSPTGRLIDSYTSSGNLVHIENYGLSNGLYFINTRSGNLNTTNKIIIKR